jgi:hypothetical protein
MQFRRSIPPTLTKRRSVGGPFIGWPARDESANGLDGCEAQQEREFLTLTGNTKSSKRWGAAPTWCCIRMLGQASRSRLPKNRQLSLRRRTQLALRTLPDREFDPEGISSLERSWSQDSDLPEEICADLARFDELPRVLRWMLHESIVYWRAEPFSRFLESITAAGDGGMVQRVQALAACMSELRATEIAELQKWARLYRQAWGCAYPHTAAGATVQRYGARGDWPGHGSEEENTKWENSSRP